MTKGSSPTLEDVAKLAGVSTASISRALNEPGKVAEATRTFAGQGEAAYCQKSDRHPRSATDHASARWECRLRGGPDEHSGTAAKTIAALNKDRGARRAPVR